MQHIDINVISQAIEWQQQGKPVWLCTVLSTYGSSPRSPGALMVATSNGRHCGSLSGGCVEEDFLRRVAVGEYTADSQVIRYGKGGMEPNVPLPCGGTLDVLIEYFPSGHTNLSYLKKMLGALRGHYSLIKHLTLPHTCNSLEPSDFSSVTHVVRQQQDITLHVAAAPCLLIAGLSNVALY
uniref:XdhC family protein n=1 Tax=Aeromonas finlandensis TaxID=1543375 RepID=UPI00240A82F5